MSSRVALLAVLLPLACAHGEATQPAAAPVSTEAPLKHVVRLAELPAELAGASAPAVFVQLLCNRLFDLNQKQVLCTEELAAIIQQRREAAMLGGQEVDQQQIIDALNVPRQVTVSASRAGDKIVFTVLVMNEKAAVLGRLEKSIKADGADLADRAAEMASAILKVK